MDIFEEVKVQVTTRQAAEFYGLQVNRNGMAKCIFHDDHNPSMKLDRRYHCFGCQADGDVIDFTAGFFGIKPYEAAVKLAEDFGLNCLSGSQDVRNKRTRGKKQAKLKPAARKMGEEKNLWKLADRIDAWLCRAQEILIRYQHLLDYWENEYRPEDPEEEWNPLFCEALGNKSMNEYRLEILVEGTEEERLDFSERSGRW